MKKNTASPKKRPRRRHKRKQLKSCPRRSLRQRLERLSALQQALAAIQSLASAARLPAVESEPEVPLPTLLPSKLLWDVTMNSESGDVPRVCGLAPYQRPPRTPSWLIASTPPLTVHAAVSRRPSVRYHQPIPRTLIFSNTKPGLTPPEHPAQHPQRFPLLWRAPLTVVMTQRLEPRGREQLPEPPLPLAQPSLPHSQPSCRRVQSLQALARVIIADSASGSGRASTDHEYKILHRTASIRHHHKEFILNQNSRQLGKTSAFSRKWNRSYKKQLSRKIIGSLQKKRPVLSNRYLTRSYAKKKTPRLSKTVSKALLTRSVRLLVPVIKQHSELFTLMVAKKLLTKPPSNLRCFFPRKPLPHDQPLRPRSFTPCRRVRSLQAQAQEVIAGSVSRMGHLSSDDKEWGVFCKKVFLKKPLKVGLLQAKSKFKKKENKPFREGNFLIRKCGSHHKKQCLLRRDGSLKKPHPALSSHRQPKVYAKKTARLLRAAGKDFLWAKRFKLLAPGIKKRSQLFTQVPVVELFRRQASSLRSPPDESPLKSGQPTFVTDNTTREKLLPVGNGEGSAFRQPISVTYRRHEIPLLNQTTLTEDQTSEGFDFSSYHVTLARLRGQNQRLSAPAPPLSSPYPPSTPL